MADKIKSIEERILFLEKELERLTRLVNESVNKSNRRFVRIKGRHNIKED